jgi:hypothetical protein
MNDKVMRMAIECQLINTSNRTGIYADVLQKFANLIRADERAACAKVCESNVWSKNVAWWKDATKSEVSVESGVQCAAAIRARGNT